MTWYKGEKVLKDTKSIFQQRFHWHRHCQNVRSLSRSSRNHNDDGKEGAKKTNNFYKKNKTLHVQHIFHTSFSWQCMTSTWNCLISLRTYTNNNKFFFLWLILKGSLTSTKKFHVNRVGIVTRAWKKKTYILLVMF